MRTLIWAAVAALAAWPLASSGAPVNLDRVEDPGAFCAALRPLGLDAGGWVESAAVAGGWRCARIAPRVAIGPPAPDGGATTLTYTVRGGAESIDRIALQLDLADDAASADGRAALLRAATMVAETLDIRLPPRIAALIATHPLAPRPDWRPTPADRGRRVLLEERQGWVRVRLEAEETRLTALVLSFINPEPSGAWE